MPKHYLAVCAIHKLEAARLREWLEYHLLIGCEHFYLMDNNDADDGTREIVRPYELAGKVTTIYSPGNYAGKQMRFYESICRQQRSTWLAGIDIDEFILPTEQSDLRVLLKEFERHAGLAVSWRCFGTGGHIDPPEYLTEAMVQASERTFENNTHIKSIVRPERVTACSTPHDFVPLPGLHIVNEHHQPAAGPYMRFTDAKVVVNHYALRSATEFREKLRRGRGDGGEPYEDDYFDRMNRNESAEPRLADRFGAEVRRRCEAAKQRIIRS